VARGAGQKPHPRHKLLHSIREIARTGDASVAIQSAAAGREDPPRPGPIHRPSRMARRTTYGQDQEALLQTAGIRGVDSVTRFNSLVPHSDVLAVEQRATGLLFFDWKDRSAAGVMPGKLFEYLRVRRPIMFIGAGFETEASEMARRSGTAVVLQSEEEIERCLEGWPRSMAACCPDDAYISELSCSKQAGLVLAEIERNLRGSRRFGSI